MCLCDVLGVMNFVFGLMSRKLVCKGSRGRSSYIYLFLVFRVVRRKNIDFYVRVFFMFSGILFFIRSIICISLELIRDDEKMNNLLSVLEGESFVDGVGVRFDRCRGCYINMFGMVGGVVVSVVRSNRFFRKLDVLCWNSRSLISGFIVGLGRDFGVRGGLYRVLGMVINGIWEFVFKEISFVLLGVDCSLLCCNLFGVFGCSFGLGVVYLVGVG